MNRKASIFTKIFYPGLAILFLQFAIINLFMLFGDTINTLDENAVNVLSKNVQIRSVELEQRMVNYWSNISSLEQAVSEGIEIFLAENELQITEILGNDALEAALLQSLSDTLIYSLRETSATGVFMYFVSGVCDTSIHSLNGLYYRSLSSLGGMANLMLIRGNVEIARQNNIPLDSFWDEMFTFDPQNEELWRSFAYPQIYRASYWSAPHILNPWQPRDVSKQITYTSPIIFGGEIIAVIGTEVQLSQLERHFPARDLDTFAQSGYMLLRLCGEYPIYAEIFDTTGTFARNLFNGVEQISLNPTGFANDFYIDGFSRMRLVFHPMRLYDATSPFFAEQWVLAAVASEVSLFAMSTTVRNVVLISAVISIILGAILMYVGLKNFIRPIGHIIKEIEENDGAEKILTDAKNYEVSKLADTINDMIKRRRNTETLIDSDRQKYLRALRITAEIFVEWHIPDDIFTVYYFEDKMQKTPTEISIPNFSVVSRSGVLFHPDDKFPDINDTLFGFEPDTTCVLRINACHFPFKTQRLLDDGYLWCALIFSVDLDKDGNILMLSGAVTNITGQKLKEYAEQEINRRDKTTGFYNHDYGRTIISKSTNLHLLRIDGFDKMEITYGRVFGGLFIAEFSHAISLLLPGKDIIRLGNNIFVVCLGDDDDTAVYYDLIKDAFASLYKGEKTEIKPTIFIKAIDHSEWQENITPIQIEIDLSDNDNFNNLVMELFERTYHVVSCVRMLLSILGRLFLLERAAVCEYSDSFGTNQIIHQWFSPGKTPLPELKIKTNDPRMQTIINHPRENTYPCEYYENAVHAGLILFARAKNNPWKDEEKVALSHITKIIATYMLADMAHSASQSKSVFLSRVSHEIRTPMYAIIGLTDIALSSSHKSAECLSKISTSANYLLTLINDVLEMSRIESGQTIELANKPFSMEELADEVVDLMRFPIEEKGIQFRLVSTFRNIHVVGDSHRLKQVLINLLSNANKFTDRGGKITLFIEEEKEGVFTFSVKDTGLGIPEELHAKIFEPFEQVSSVSEGGIKGTGLGLAISRSIISAMGGKINLHSTPGNGANFYFTVKLTLSDAPLSTANNEIIDYKNAFLGKRILLVDDVEINIEIAQHVLEDAGFEVETATNGALAVESYKQNPIGYYNAILMDIQMPVMDGIEATKEIRRSTRPDAKKIPIIAVTANAFDADLKKSVESGMNGHLSKPIEVGKLMELLQQHV